MKDFSEKSALSSYLGPTFINSNGEEIQILSITAEQPKISEVVAVAINPHEVLRWTDCIRDDLRHIPLAVLYKWQTKFSINDKNSGRIHPHNVPLDPLIFTKDNKVIWQVYGIVKENHGCYFPLIAAWRFAEFRRGKYTNFKVYESLTEALTKEK